MSWERGPVKTQKYLLWHEDWFPRRDCGRLPSLKVEWPNCNSGRRVTQFLARRRSWDPLYHSSLFSHHQRSPLRPVASRGTPFSHHERSPNDPSHTPRAHAVSSLRRNNIRSFAQVTRSRGNFAVVLHCSVITPKIFAVTFYLRSKTPAALLQLSTNVILTHLRSTTVFKSTVLYCKCSPPFLIIAHFSFCRDVLYYATPFPSLKSRLQICLSLTSLSISISYLYILPC